MRLALFTAWMNACSSRLPTCEVFSLREARLGCWGLASIRDTSTRLGVARFADATNVHGTWWSCFALRADFIAPMLARRSCLPTEETDPF
jgi:hypothetical protein